MIKFASARIVQGGAIAVAALLAASVSAPLQAAAVGQQSAEQQASPSAGSDRRICVMVDLPSSRMTRRVCRTRSEWEAQGGVPRND
jgi:hypothetical protein